VKFKDLKCQVQGLENDMENCFSIISAMVTYHFFSPSSSTPFGYKKERNWQLVKTREKQAQTLIFTSIH